MEMLFACLGVFVFCTFLGVLIMQHFLIKDLTNKIMAKNYGEYVQAEMLKKPVEIKPGLDVKIQQKDNQPDDVETLNQLL